MANNNRALKAQLHRTLNWRFDLEELRKKLASWQTDLDAFEDIIERLEDSVVANAQAHESEVLKLVSG